MSSNQREERIKIYAYKWYRIRQDYNISGNAHSDWERATHIIEAEEYASSKLKEKGD